MHRHRLLSLTVGSALLLAARGVPAQVLDSNIVAGFKWRSPGPANFMGRLSDVAAIPSPSKTIYVSAAAGGVWKSTNNGVTWRPIFDDKRIASLGDMAIAPSDTNQVWVGSGEPNTRNSIEPGSGIYKSTDGGATWRMMGLARTQHIGRIVVDPRDANVVWVAAGGPVWASGGERGLYKTTDGGANWTLVKAGANANTGFIDVALDPRNPDVMWAASWERIRTPYSLNSGGPGSALWKSTDAGRTWTEIKGNGYPEGRKGRIGIGIAPSNPDVVYAITEAATMAANQPYRPGQNDANGLYRSTDGGRTWQRMNNKNTRPFYYSQVTVDPRNPDRVYYSSTPVHISNDGGRTEMMQPTNLLHVDTHAIWVDPNDAERIIHGNDGGIAISFDKGGNWYYPMNLPIAQFYEVSYDMAIPYNICGGAQDNGSWCGPSKRRGEINNSYWFTVSGGDGFYTQQDPTDPSWIWSESQGGNFSGRNIKTGQTLRITKPTWQELYRRWEDSIATLRGDPLRPASAAINQQITALRGLQRQDSIDLVMRYNWNSPFFISPHNPQTMYFAGNRMLKSTKRGEEMYPISPDLSKLVMPQYRAEMTARADTANRLTGGITNDATGAETYNTIVSIAESYVKPGLLYAGTDDGNVWVSNNDGGTWEEVSTRIPGLPRRDIYVENIEPSHFDPQTFYVVFDNHRWNDFTPYVYVTNDGGKSFRSIAANLPKDSPADYARVIREDPYNRDLLFVGTSLSVYASIDRGATWTKFAHGLPSTPIYDMKIHPRDRELIVATHGRGFWIVPIGALEQITPRVLAGGAYLFKPTTAYQWSEPPTLGIPGNGHGQHPLTIPSPPYGATLTYRVAAGVSGSAQIAVSDASGETIFQTTGPASAGVHNVVWPFSVTRATPAQPTTLSPSQRRDSILLNARAPHVLDSLQRAGYDTAAVGAVRRQVDALRSGQAPPQAGGRGGAGGGGGGRGFGGPPGVYATCHHPMTQWDPFCARPVEVPVQGGGGRGAGGGGGGGGRGGAASADVGPIQRIWGIIGMSPAAAGGGGRGGGGGFGGGGLVAPTGDYLVTLTVGGQTYKQTFRVEQTNNAGMSSPFSPEEQAKAKARIK
jgi:photosystem II stability/assembly factor-like uncharacterized protein